MQREFRSYTRKENRRVSETSSRAGSKMMSRAKNNSENQPEYERLTYGEIQHITRSLLKDSKAHDHNMGVIASIKGKMYCLKLGEVSSSKDFSHYFYSNQYRRRHQVEPLKPKFPVNSMFCTNISKF